MTKFLVFIMTILCVGVLVYGQNHWKNMNEAMGFEGQQIIEQNLQKKQVQRQLLINSLNPESNQSQSMIDFLRYRSLTRGKAIIAVLGSNITVGVGEQKSWQEVLKRKLKLENEDLETLEIINHGYEGYTTTDLLTGEKLDVLIKAQPDIVFFENMMITNYYRSLTLEQTVKDLEEIISTLHREIPDAKIIIMSPPPIVNGNNLNNLGLSYEQYIKESEKLIRENNWSYINSLEEMTRKLKERNILLVDILSSGDFNLNNQGYFLWIEILDAHLKNK